jgi:hypothetical protein
MTRVAAGIVLILAASAVPASADRVYLRGGGAIDGEVANETADAVVIDVGPGRMTLPMSRVLRIESSTSDLAVFRGRAAALAPNDAAGWTALARWARDRGLLTQAREAYERALSADPQHPEANAAVGRVLVRGRWVDEDEANRERGLVPFEGSWTTPAERDAILVERQAASDARRADLEAEARVREAEARARTAEAEARRAEAEAARASEAETGIPYDWVLTGGPYGPIYGPVYGPPPGHVPGGRWDHRRDHPRPPRPRADAPPRVKPQPVPQPPPRRPPPDPPASPARKKR